MKKLQALSFLLMILIVSLSIAYSSEKTTLPKSKKTTTKLAAQEDESQIAFDKMMDVLTHQRCVNCHPSDNVPKQGEDSHAHRFDITRATVGNTTNCNTCHQSSNNDFSGVPGAPDWSLAPHSMRWEGLSRIEIARSMMNLENNGNRTPEDIMRHLTEHELVLWAWEPGIDASGNPREIPSVPKDEYIKAVKKWIELGAVIPDESKK